MSLYPYVNEKVIMDGITGTSSSIDSHDPDHQVLTYTVLKDSTGCTEENASTGMETSPAYFYVTSWCEKLELSSNNSEENCKEDPSNMLPTLQSSHKDAKESMDICLLEKDRSRRGSHKEKKPATKKTWRGRLLPTDEKPWRKQKFIDKWMEDDKFKGWLARHPEDPTLARCVSCNQELVAGKSELIKHSQTRKHIKSLQNFDSTNVETESIPAKTNQPMLVWVLNDQECPATTEVKVIENKMLQLSDFISDLCY